MSHAKRPDFPLARMLSAILAGCALGLVLMAVYVMFGPKRNGQTDLAASNRAATAGANELITGNMITFVIKKPAALPKLTFSDDQGNERSLADWRGKTVLVNLWATWCAPCRREMPSLARLDRAFEGQPFDVVAISVDRKGLAASAKFLKEIGAEKLGLYVDPSGKVAQDLKSFGLPTSVLVDPQGREIGRLVGPAEWDSNDAKRLIRAAIDGKLAKK